MIFSKEPTDSATLAEAVLTAIERADQDKRNLGLDDLRNELPSLADEFGTEPLKTILVATGCTCANELVATWVRVCPDDEAPLLALEATRAWLVDPTEQRAARSGSLSQAALDSFARTKGTGQRPSWPAHAWFARSCAWLADAPQYGWQSVAALLGLIKAGMRRRVVSELQTQLRDAAHGKG
jgi:hypothetical protein